VRQPASTDDTCDEVLVPLIYELLDAHDDTAQLASELACDDLWQAHLEYLRALQRKGREVLAEVSPAQSGQSSRDRSRRASA
jgi:hypothetical protein